MKTKAKLFVIILLTANLSVFGQKSESKPVKKIRIHEVSIQAGMFSEQNTNPVLSDFKSLAPKSLLLNNDFSDYFYSQGYRLNSNGMISVMMGINVNGRNKIAKKTNPLIKVGFSCITGTTLTSELVKFHDTIISKPKGFIDSTSTKSCIMNYSSTQIRLDGSLILRTNTMKRWSFFSGIGMTVGVSINAHTDVISTSSESTYASFVSGNNIHVGINITNTYNKETFRNKNAVVASTYIPMGIDFRIGKKRALWKQMHLFYEFRPGLNVMSIPELRTITNMSLQQGLGIKFNLNN